MKKKIFLLSIIFLLGFTTFAKAHTFLTDRDITILLHTNPDDDPIAGSPAAVLFQITDSTNKFDVSKCDCNLIISQGNKELFNGSLLHVVGTSVYDLTEPFTFPRQAVYQLAVSGKPKTSGTFQNFNVKFDLRVDRGTNVTQSSVSDTTQIWLTIVGLLGIAIIVGVIIYFKKN